MKTTIMSACGLQAVKILWTMLLGVMAGLSGMSFCDSPFVSCTDVAPIFLVGWIVLGIFYRFSFFSRSLKILFVGIALISAFAYGLHLAGGGRQADWIPTEGRIMAAERHHTGDKYGRRITALWSRYTYCYHVAGEELQGTFWEWTSLSDTPEKRRIRYVNDRVSVYYDPKCPSASEPQGRVTGSLVNGIFTFLIIVVCLVVMIKWIVVFVFAARSRREMHGVVKS